MKKIVTTCTPHPAQTAGQRKRRAAAGGKICRGIGLLAALLTGSLLANAQPVPPFATCTYDNTNGSPGAVSIYDVRQIPQYGSYQLATAGLSGTDGLFTSTYNTLKNVSGGDYSDVIVMLTETGYWSQTYFNNNNYKFNWDPVAKWWTKTATDGTAMTIRLYSVSVNGSSIPASQIHMVPLALKASSTSYAPLLVPSTSDMSNPDQFYDGGTGITHVATTLTPPLPANYIGVDLGPLANGQSLNNVVFTFAISYADGRNPYTGYSGDWGAGDVDFYVFNTVMLATSGYDYGDAPASYGIARHAPHPTNASGFCPAAGPIFIGPARPDYELSAKQSAACNGDDTATDVTTNTAGYTDEEATLPDYTGNTSYSASIPYVNNSGGSGTLSAWIDWNANGVFDASENAQVTVPAGSSNATLTWRKTAPGAGEGTLPASLTTGNKVVRIRIGTVASEVTTPTGTASDGEVEDRLLNVTSTVPLPVTLTSFTGTRSGASDLLNWTTASEQGTGSFDIEYSSDGIAFTLSGSVAAAGNSNQQLQYHYTNNNVTGTAYYRLKTGYQDGSSSYSPVIRVGNGASASGAGNLSLGTIYPVPFTDALVLSLNSSISTTADVMLFTLSGNKVAEKSISLSEGLASYSLSGLGYLPQGMYVIKVQTATDVLTAKVIK